MAAPRPVGSRTKAASPPQPASPPSRSIISKGATARSAVSTPVRASSVRKSATVASSPLANGTSSNHSVDGGPSREVLAASLKKEMETKEDLLVQVQDRDQHIQGLNGEIDTLRAGLKTASAQLTEFYNEQTRMDDELAANHAIADKLREQLKEVEMETRELNRRYNEQAKSFEAERQSFYDNEQHLKSRIQSLTRPRVSDRKRRSMGQESNKLSEHEETLEEGQETISHEPDHDKDEINEEASDQESGEDTDTPEISALKLELTTLSTSYSSMQSTLQLLQIQLADLQRVNNQLQDENESYNILLRERTMAGQIDLSSYIASEEGNATDVDADGRSVRSTTRSALGRVSELEELQGEEDDHNHASSDIDPFNERPSSRTSARRTRSGANSPMQRGESLAGLPITGPGLDLAAELGRAENKDITDTQLINSNDSPIKLRAKRGNRLNETKLANLHGAEVDTLRSEVKSLKDANKALSLYASKIIDRIIAQEGFEHVLAVDYSETPTTPSATQPPVAAKKSRPQSFLFGMGPSSTEPVGTTDPAKAPQVPAPSPNSRRERRSMSFDWKSLSLWGGSEKKPEPSHLRPLTLRPGAMTVVGAKKLDVEEDDEDRVERERLNATMKLMGIDPPSRRSQNITTPTLPISPALNSPANSSGSGSRTNKRWSLFRAPSSTSEKSSSGSPPPPLTAEALQHVEANETLKQLDESERERIDALSKGSPSGFTEARPRASLSDEWRSRRDARHGRGSTASGSTVWSAGMSSRDDFEGTKQGSP